MAVEYLLDTSALLALMFAEKGRDQVHKVLHKCAMSAVNLTEAVGKIVQRGAPLDEAWEHISALAIPTLAYDEATAREAVRFCALAWTRGMSIADRICVATALVNGLVAVTADRRWPSFVTLPKGFLVIR
jgi:PIN domain nuclease of toxin-antitoxin system